MKHDPLRPWLRALALLALLAATGCTSSPPAPADAAPPSDGVDPLTDGPPLPTGDGKLPPLPDGPLPPRDGGGSSCDPYSGHQPAPEIIIGPTGLEAKLLAHVNSAKTKLHVMMYQLTLTSFVDAFIAAKNRGVDVRIILDGKQPANTTSKAKLVAGGVAVRDAPARFDYFHAKVLLVDDARAVVMSGNLIYYTVSGERNYGVLLQDPDDLADIAAIFLKDWDNAGDPDLSCTRLLVSPVNAKARLLDLINRAKTTLDLAVMYISEKDVLAAVKARAAAGVTVRVLLANPSWIKDNAALAAELTAAKVAAKYYLPLDLHCKLVISDGIALVGSHNMSWTSLSKNREIGLLVTDAAGKTAITNQFNTDWNVGTAP